MKLDVCDSHPVNVIIILQGARPCLTLHCVGLFSSVGEAWQELYVGRCCSEKSAKLPLQGFIFLRVSQPGILVVPSDILVNASCILGIQATRSRATR